MSCAIATTETKKSRDLKMGMANEIKVHPMIEEYFEMKVQNTKETQGKYCAYDYESIDLSTRYELKSRRVHSKAYDEVFISTRKIKKGYKYGCRLVLLFLFSDGLYTIDYNREVFSKFRVQEISNMRDGRYEDDEVIYIPNTLLTKINV
jgi:hypothetical protein